jgi:hypothetical protein
MTGCNNNTGRAVTCLVTPATGQPVTAAKPNVCSHGPQGTPSISLLSPYNMALLLSTPAHDCSCPSQASSEASHSDLHAQAVNSHKAKGQGSAADALCMLAKHGFCSHTRDRRYGGLKSTPSTVILTSNTGISCQCKHSANTDYCVSICCH